MPRGLLVGRRRRAAAAASCSLSSSFGAQSFSSSRSASCSVYWYCGRDDRPPTRDVLRRLQEQARALHRLQLRPQPRDDLIGRWPSRSSRGFSVMNIRPVVDASARRRRPTDADPGRHVRVPADDRRRAAC